MTSCYWIWWSAIQEFSLHVACGEHQKMRTYVTVVFMRVTIVTSEPLTAEDKETNCLPLKEIIFHTLCWSTVRPVSSLLKKWREDKLITRSNGSNTLKNSANLAFVNLFTVAAQVTCGLRNFSRGWRHIKLHSHFQPALPCCTENRGGKTIFYGKIKLGRWHCGRKGSWGCLRTWCWLEYLDLGGTR